MPLSVTDGNKRSIRILGVDPGSRLCGYAFVSSTYPHRNVRKCVQLDDIGVIRANLELPFLERIGLLHDALFGLVEEFKPDICIMEDAFFGVNAKSALKLGQAKGALLTAVSRCRIPVKEVSPTHVKRTVVGNGAADKEQVSMALRALVGFERGKLPYDASDALAIALSYGLNMSQIDVRTSKMELQV